MKKALMILSTTALLAIVLAPPASAQLPSADRSTVLTFSGPIALPGVALPAGSYLFKFASPNLAADVLEVMSADGKASYAMLHTIPVERTETKANHKQVVTFRETPENQPQQIDAWYFDAADTPRGWDDVGCELLYTK
jgi:hypothetical protein